MYTYKALGLVKNQQVNACNDKILLLVRSLHVKVSSWWQNDQIPFHVTYCIILYQCVSFVLLTLACSSLSIGGSEQKHR